MHFLFKILKENLPISKISQTIVASGLRVIDNRGNDVKLLHWNHVNKIQVEII